MEVSLLIAPDQAVKRDVELAPAMRRMRLLRSTTS